MSLNPNYELSSSDDSDFNDDDSSIKDEDNIIEYDFENNSTQVKSSKKNYKRNYEAKKKIEQIKEERRLKKLLEDDYDDWD
jgi:hypothetical protein